MDASDMLGPVTVVLASLGKPLLDDAEQTIQNIIAVQGFRCLALTGFALNGCKIPTWTPALSLTVVPAFFPNITSIVEGIFVDLYAKHADQIGQALLAVLTQDTKLLESILQRLIELVLSGVQTELRNKITSSILVNIPQTMVVLPRNFSPEKDVSHYLLKQDLDVRELASQDIIPVDSKPKSNISSIISPQALSPQNAEGILCDSKTSPSQTLHSVNPRSFLPQSVLPQSAVTKNMAYGMPFLNDKEHGSYSATKSTSAIAVIPKDSSPSSVSNSGQGNSKADDSKMDAIETEPPFVAPNTATLNHPEAGKEAELAQKSASVMNGGIVKDANLMCTAPPNPAIGDDIVEPLIKLISEEISKTIGSNDMIDLVKKQVVVMLNTSIISPVTNLTLEVLYEFVGISLTFSTFKYILPVLLLTWFLFPIYAIYIVYCTWKFPQTMGTKVARGTRAVLATSFSTAQKGVLEQILHDITKGDAFIKRIAETHEVTSLLANLAPKPLEDLPKI